MRRNLDLIRDMLTTTADASQPVTADTFTNPQHPLPEVIYHMRLLQQAGLAQATIRTTWDGHTDATLDELTWKGQDYLESIRDERLWARLKHTIATTTAGVSLDTVKALAVKLAADMLGL